MDQMWDRVELTKKKKNDKGEAQKLKGKSVERRVSEGKTGECYKKKGLLWGSSS